MGNIVEVIVSCKKPKEGLQETEKRDKIAVFLPFAGGNWREMLAYRQFRNPTAYHDFSFR